MNTTAKNITFKQTIAHVCLTHEAHTNNPTNVTFLLPVRSNTHFLLKTKYAKRF